MDAVSDGNLVARILLTLATLGYGFATIKADFNKTHATNPNWTPHARFHVVWQILSYSGIAVIALCLIWFDGPMPRERLYLAAALALAVYGAFFLTAIGRSLYGGTLFDDNGYLPFKAPLGTGKWDVNVTVFGVLTAVLVGGFSMIG